MAAPRPRAKLRPIPQPPTVPAAAVDVANLFDPQATAYRRSTLLLLAIEGLVWEADSFSLDEDEIRDRALSLLDLSEDLHRALRGIVRPEGQTGGT